MYYMKAPVGLLTAQMNSAWGATPPSKASTALEEVGGWHSHQSLNIVQLEGIITNQTFGRESLKVLTDLTNPWLLGIWQKLAALHFDCHSCDVKLHLIEGALSWALFFETKQDISWGDKEEKSLDDLALKLIVATAKADDHKLIVNTLRSARHWQCLKEDHPVQARHLLR